MYTKSAVCTIYNHNSVFKVEHIFCKFLRLVIILCNVSLIWDLMGVAMLWDTFWWNLPLYVQSGCTWRCFTLQWRHNGRDGVSNHQPHHCLLKRLFRRRSKKTSKLRITGLCAGNSPVTVEFPTQIVFPRWWLKHYTDVIMSAMASNHRRLGCFSQPFVQAQIKENIKASRHWPLWWDFTGDRWTPLTKGQ